MTIHFTDDAVSEYARGRVTEREIETVFEHLLECDDCNSRYDAELTFGKSMREALSRSVVDPAAPTPSLNVFSRGDLLAQLERHSH